MQSHLAQRYTLILPVFAHGSSDSCLAADAGNKYWPALVHWHRQLHFKRPHLHQLERLLPLVQWQHDVIVNAPPKLLTRLLQDVNVVIATHLHTKD